MLQDIDINLLLTKFGLRKPEAEKVYASMVISGITRRGKRRIAISKKPDVAHLIKTQFVRACHKSKCRDEAARLASQKPAMRLGVSPSDCEICKGSANDFALEQITQTMKLSGWVNLLILGGSRSTRQSIREALPHSRNIRFVTADSAHSGRVASENKRWADVIVIWASTAISHKVTSHYHGPKTITVARRGVASLAMDVTRHLERRAARAGKTRQ